MRISDTKVAQLAESVPPFLVLVDESTGREARLTRDEISDFMHNVSAGDRPVSLKGISLSTAEETYLVFACGYFWMALNAWKALNAGS